MAELEIADRVRKLQNCARRGGAGEREGDSRAMKEFGGRGRSVTPRVRNSG